MANFLYSRTFFLSLFFILCYVRPNYSPAQIAVSLSADKSTICSGDSVKFTVFPYSSTYTYELLNSNDNAIIDSAVGENIFVNTFTNNSSAPINVTLFAKVSGDKSTLLTITINPTPIEAQYDNTLNYNFTRSDDVVSLESYIKPINNTSIINEWFTPQDNLILNSGQNTFFFLPSEVSSTSSLDLHYSVSNQYNCFSEYIVPHPFFVVNPLTPPPSFVHNLNPSGPICEQSESISFSVSLPDKGIVKVEALYSDHIATLYSGIARSTVNDLKLNPKLHPINNYSIPVRVWALDSPVPTIGYFSIYPRRTVEINGINKTSIDNINYRDSASLCSVNKDTIVLTGFPIGGNFNFEFCIPGNSNCSCKDLVCFNSFINSKIKIDPINSTLKFIPEEIFKTLTENNYNSIIDISYNYPIYSQGACPEIRHLYLKFSNPIDLTFASVSPVGPYCQSDTMKFNLINKIPGDKVLFDYGDNFSMTNYDTASHYIHYYDRPGKFIIRFKTMRAGASCNNDIVDTIRVGSNPQADFNIENNYEDLTAKLTSLSVLKIKNTDTTDKINSWSWHYGNGREELNKKDPVAYTIFQYYKSKPYRVRHIVKTSWGCTDTIIRKIPIFPIIDLKNSNYEQNFDRGDSTGFYNSLDYNIGGNSSWKYTFPHGSIINSSSPAWVTENGKQDTSYNFSEFSWIESPAFNLSALALPMLGLDTWCLTEYQIDGACLQWTFADSYFGKEEWHTIGLKEEGINWYNSNIVVSMLSVVESSNLFHPGWTGNTGNHWLSSRFNLDAIKAIAGNRLIRFRILFVSNADNAPGKYDGFAFDNFFLGERNRKVLVEEFCDYENYETSFSQPQFRDHKQLIRIQYHSGFMHPDDQLYKDNKGEINARNLLYGYNTLPRAAVDGRYIDYDHPFFENSGEDNFNLRQLEIAPYSIVIDQVNVYNNELKFKVYLTKNTLPNNKEPVSIQVAVLEDSVYVNGNSFSNVFRKFLPDAAGVYVESVNWPIGETKVIDRTFTPYTSLTSRRDKDTCLIIVAFIQDETTNEIFQSEAYFVLYEEVKNILPIADNQKLSTLNNFSLYPNPNSGSINIHLSNDFSAEASTYRIVDSQGEVVYSGSIEKGKQDILLSEIILPIGFYQFQLMNDNTIETKNFSVIK